MKAIKTIAAVTPDEGSRLTFERLIPSVEDRLNRAMRAVALVRYALESELASEGETDVIVREAMAESLLDAYDELHWIFRTGSKVLNQAAPTDDEKSVLGGGR